MFISLLLWSVSQVNDKGRAFMFFFCEDVFGKQFHSIPEKLNVTQNIVSLKSTFRVLVKYLEYYENCGKFSLSHE